MLWASNVTPVRKEPAIYGKKTPMVAAKVREYLPHSHAYHLLLFCLQVPSQQPPPFHIPHSPSKIELIWDPPDWPNAAVNDLDYKLYRNGVLLKFIKGTGNDSGIETSQT